MISTRSLIILCLFLIFQLNCNNNEPTELKMGNQNPVISGIIVSPPVISPGGKSFITVNASDPDRDTLFVSYSATEGSISLSNGMAVYKADSAETIAWITIEVNDRKGGIATGSANIIVTSNPPLISVTAQIVNSKTPEVPCLLFTAWSQETLLIDLIEVENPIGQIFTLDPFGAQIKEGEPFPLQDQGVCYTVHSGEYKFTFHLLRDINDNPFIFETTHLQP